MKMTSRAGLFLLLAALCSLQTIAQESDSTATNDLPATKEDVRKNQDYFYFDFNWDRLIGLEDVRQHWYGRGIAFGGMFDYGLNDNGNVSLAIGVGFNSNNYYTNALVTRDSADRSGFQVLTERGTLGDSTTNFVNIRKRSKLSVNYVEVPFEFRFRTNPNKYGQRWKLAVGGKVGYMFQAHEKIVDRNDLKTKLYDYPNVTQLRYGATMRAGYGSIMLNAFYGFSPLFEDGKSRQTLNQFSLGISLVPF